MINICSILLSKVIFADTPTTPILSIPNDATVGGSVLFQCIMTNDGNPPSNETEWRKTKTSGIWNTASERTITVPIASVLQEDNYTCNLINYPQIGRQSSYLSNTKHLIVNGLFQLIKNNNIKNKKYKFLIIKRARAHTLTCKHTHTRSHIHTVRYTTHTYKYTHILT